jgi:hypothetical protein
MSERVNFVLRLVRRFLEIIFRRPVCSLAMPAATRLESHPAYRHTAISLFRMSVRSGRPATWRRSAVDGTARSAATGCTKTRRREIHRTNGLLANDRQNDGHALCVAPAGNGQQNAQLGDTGSFVDEDGMMSFTNSWAIECCDENLTETSAAVPHTRRWESDMPQELKTAQELVEIVSKALDANADTTGWSQRESRSTLKTRRDATGTSTICMVTAKMQI